jgi:hypothetical protein
MNAPIHPSQSITYMQFLQTTTATTFFLALFMFLETFLDYHQILEIPMSQQLLDDYSMDPNLFAGAGLSPECNILMYTKSLKSLVLGDFGFPWSRECERTPRHGQEVVRAHPNGNHECRCRHPHVTTALEANLHPVRLISMILSSKIAPL